MTAVRASPWLRLLATMTAIAIIAACSSGGEEPVSKELNIYNWEDYFAPDTLENFEAEFGIKVTLDTYPDENVMLSVVQSDPSKYDLAVASNLMVHDMAELALLAELDHSRIPNLANIDDEFLDPTWDPGNRFSVPYTWGTIGLVYNARFVDGPVASWDLLWDPKLSGRIAMLNNHYVDIQCALKELGCSLSSTDPAELAEAEAKLIEQRPLLRGYPDPVEIMELLVSGELWAAPLYNGDAIVAMASNEDLVFVLPKEGSGFWVDNLVIPRDTKHKDAAELFINYILRPEVQAAVSNYTAYATPNRAAIEQGLIDDELLSSPAVYPDRTLLEPWHNLGEAVSLWNELWANVQASAAGIAPPASE